MNRSASRVPIFVVFLLVFSGVATGGAIAGPNSADVTTDAAPVAVSAVDTMTTQEDAPGTALTAVDEHDEENETKRHENPDNSGEDGDLGKMETWLSGWMGGQLGDATIQLTEGQYDLAREYIGEEYQDRFSTYVDVAGETDGESAEDEFREAQTQQERLIGLVEQYRETQDEYEQALEAGDTERARELARELNAYAEEIDDTTATLQELFEEIDAETDADLSEALEALQELEQEIQVEQAEIQTDIFVETELTVEAESETISFLDPLAVTGELQTAEGEPISNESVRIAVGDRVTQVETESDGSFTVEYRPTDLPLSTSALSVRYLPANQSEYLGSEADLNVTIEQVQPQIDEFSASEEVAYGESVTVEGALTVDDVPVDGVTLEVLVDGQQIGEVQVADGSFTGAVELPAAVPAGEQSLTIRLPYEDQALANVSATQDVLVRETETTLSLDATQDGEDQVRVTGTLETVDGLGIEGAPVQVSIEGLTVGTVTTGADGSFAETVAVPDSVDADEIRVHAVYQGTGSNLRRSEDEIVVNLTEINDTGGENQSVDGSGDEDQSSDNPVGNSVEDIPVLGNSIGDTSLPIWVWLALALGVLVLGSGLWWLRKYIPIPFANHPLTRALANTILRRDSNIEEGSTPDDTSQTQGSDQDGPSTATALFQHAAEELQAGSPAVAVEATYSAVRQDLESRMDAAGAPTHWEFYRQYRETEEGEAPDALQAITEAYERAVFSVDDVSLDDAQTVLERAQQLCEVDDSVTDSSTVADD